MTRSVSTPIVLTAIAVSLSIAMLVGWILVVVQTYMREPEMGGGVWLLVLGIGSLLFVATVLVMFGISLVREILEARRQVSFIDSVTHELKSPLASIQLCLQTLKRPEITDSQRAELREMMGSDVRRLATFIDDVLHASHVTSGSLPSSVSEINLQEMLEMIAANVVQRHGLGPEVVDLDVEQEGGLILLTDRVALEVALTNLLDNAVKYSDPPVKVGVSASRGSDGKVAIEISDEGIGIEKRDLRRVFHRFYRVPDKVVRARRGTGLGLYVVSAMVRSLGGDVQASSEGIGKGTKMRLTLPASSLLEG